MVLILALLLQAPGTQASLETNSGVHEVSFGTLHGIVKTYLPDDARPGEPVSGAVQLEPAGRDEAERRQNLGALTGYVLESQEQRVPAGEKAARWRSGAGFLRLVDARGREFGRVLVPLHNGNDPRPDSFDFPGSAQAGALLAVYGPFTGDLTGTRVSLGGEEQQVLAESRGKVVVRAAGKGFGQTRIEVQKGELRARAMVRYVGIQLQATSTTLLRGQTATLTVTVYGIQGIDRPAPLHLANLTPSVVTMSGGESQQELIEPARAGGDGTYRTQRMLTGLNAGAFNIRAVVQLSPTANLRLVSAVDRTLDNWTRNTGIAITSEARALIQQQLQASRSTLDGILAQQSAFGVDEGALLETAVRQYCFELRDRQRGRPQADRGRRPFAMGFVQAVAASLGGSDVRGFPFLEFLARVLLPLSSRPVGHLEIQSDPTDAEILLNKERKGYTNKVFVVSAGDHDLQVRSGSRRFDCEKHISVAAGRRLTVLCKR